MGRGGTTYPPKYTAAKYQRLIDWLNTPRPLRQPRTRAALAGELGISVWTLDIWRKRPQVAALVHVESGLRYCDYCDGWYLLHGEHWTWEKSHHKRYPRCKAKKNRRAA